VTAFGCRRDLDVDDVRVPDLAVTLNVAGRDGLRADATGR
jgi:hypothetical protein